MVFTRPLISESFSPFTNTLEIVSSVPTTIPNIITFSDYYYYHWISKGFIYLLLLNFFRFLKVFRRVFTQDLAWRKIVIICSLCSSVVFFLLFFYTFFCHIIIIIIIIIINNNNNNNNS